MNSKKIIIYDNSVLFKILDEIKSDDLYRKCKVDFSDFTEDFNKSKETEIHRISFSKLKKKFKKKYPRLKIELKIISLNKKIEHFN